VKKILLSVSLISLMLFPYIALAENVTVEVSHNSLEPASVSISPGDTVTFHNKVEMPGGHTIVADDGTFSSPDLAKDESWSHKFTETGTYHYHIKQHPDAKGEIVVK